VKNVMKAIGVLALLSLPAAARPLTPYSRQEVLTTGHRLAAKIGMPEEKRVLIENRLGTVLRDLEFQARAGGPPISGVFAYQIGEGGFIVKYKSGKGVLRLRDDADDESLQLKSWAVGAMVGGSSEWGIGLVTGLEQADDLGGDYSGNNKSAAAGSAGTGITELSSKNPHAFHKIYLVGSSSGLTANAGRGTLTIHVRR
jgi:hypothetical protein